VLSELFGHRKGAFTGALEARQGAFEAADGGTLFLDEIGELPLDLQPTLLRALESGEVKPVGSVEARHVRVRVVAATNKDLEKEVDAGRFREDLFYRLAVVRLRIPPLRERTEDIPILAQRFAEHLGLPVVPAELLESAARHTWPGNARELRNAVHAYAALGTLPRERAPDGGALASALRASIALERPYAEMKDELTEQFTRLYLTLLLARTGGNQSEAARISGINRQHLWKMLQRLGPAR